jgi:hypothetical protein
MSGLNSLQSSREGNNIPLGKPIFTGKRSHSGKHSEILLGRVAPSLAAPSNSEKAAAELPLRLFLDQNTRCVTRRLTHLCRLSTGGFGDGQNADSLTQIKGFVTEPAA